MPKEKIDPNLAWLIANKDYLRIYKLETDIGIGEGLLRKFVIGKRKLPAKWHDPVIKRVKELRK
jgi:hypothetical protein